MNRRGVPAKIKTMKLKRKGDHVEMTNNLLQIIKRKNRKDVTILSTLHDATFQAVPQPGGDNTEALRPVAVLEYNKYTGAVDRSDQILIYGSFRRRTLKWWKKTFFHMLMLGVLNAYILYKEHYRLQNGLKTVDHGLKSYLRARRLSVFCLHATWPSP